MGGALQGAGNLFGGLVGGFVGGDTSLSRRVRRTLSEKKTLNDTFSVRSFITYRGLHVNMVMS